MSVNLEDEIKILKNKLELLEKQKQYDEEQNKINNIDYNLTTLNKFIYETKTNIDNNRYSKSIPLARYNDTRIVSYLEPIYNILKNLHEKLDKLEKK